RCLQENEKSYLTEIASIEASDDPPARKAAKIARRRQYIAKGRRQMATSWFDTAVACYNLARKTEAQQYAELVAADEQFGERAKEILARIRWPQRRASPQRPRRARRQRRTPPKVMRRLPCGRGWRRQPSC